MIIYAVREVDLIKVRRHGVDAVREPHGPRESESFRPEDVW